MGAWRALEALRTEYLGSTPQKFNGGLHLPETLPWGDEKWERLHDLPQEAALRDALARCALYHPAIVDGLPDGQNDEYPVGVAFYRRAALSDLIAVNEDGSMDEKAVERAIVQVRGAFYPACGEHYVNNAADCVLEPMSVSALLADLPSPVWVREARECVDEFGFRRVERAIFDAAARCAPFVALCVGEAPALTPAQALEVLCGTCHVIVKEKLAYAKDCEWEIGVSQTTKYDDDDEEDDEEYEDDDEERIVLELGIDMIESALKAKLAEVAAKHAIGHAGLAAAAATDAALGLQWDETMAAVLGTPNAMQHAAHG